MNDQFFTLENVSEEDGVHIATVSLNPTHSVYQGHFPEQPIAPGVMLMDMCRNVAGSILNAEFRIASARSMKFVKIVDPNNVQSLRIKITFQDSEAGQQMNCVASWDDDTYFKIVATITQG